MESFCQVIGVANAVIHVDGMVILDVGWRDACCGFHHRDAAGCRRFGCEAVLLDRMARGTPCASYHCPNGLIDAAAPIIVGGEHVANVFAGPFLGFPPDPDSSRQRARQFGFDEAAYLAALARIPVLPQERVESVTRLYAQLAGTLGDCALDRLRQAQSAAELARLNQVLEEKVTARTQALAKSNEALEAREFLLKQILDTSSVAIFLVDTAGRIVQANQRMAEMFGCPVDALQGSDYVGLIHPTERAIGQERLLALLHSDIPRVDLERCYWRADHTEFWGQLTGRRCYDVAGQTLGLVGVIVDISLHRRAEQDLRVAAIAFESQEGMFITDAEQTILRVNRSFSEITGYSAAEAVGQRPQLLNSGCHDAEFFATMTENLRCKGWWQGEISNRRKSGEIHAVWLTITAVKNAAGALSNYVASLSDITARKVSEDTIKHLAFYDTLTGLPNRALLVDRLRQSMSASARSGSYGALLFLDLDNFKALNDTQGLAVGDLLLKQVTHRLAGCVREGDTVARLGGDEFVVLLVGLSTNEGVAVGRAETVADKIVAVLNHGYPLGDVVYQSTVSIGVTLYRGQLETIDDLMKQADLAMYRAKDAGRNTFRFFDPAMELAASARAALEEDLRRAIDERQFVLHYQAQVVDDGRLSGAEVLVRWQHPERGMVSPAEFIPLAEETGLILPLGQWVLETACRQLFDWASQAALAHLTVAVNVSARQFRQHDFVEQVLGVLETTGANPQRLKLELTESLLVSDVEDIIEKMLALKAQGVGFSLDDFGTGYSSMSYLKRLPLDQLKIDQSFVRDVLSDPNDAAIARTIIALGRSLDLGVIAEGVETAAQRDFLSRAGCHAYQGYFFGRPQPLDAFEIFALS